MKDQISFGRTGAGMLRIFVVVALVVLAAQSDNAAAQGFTNLHTFNPPAHDGYGPRAGLTRGSDGNFYGTTLSGGTSNWGTVFRISPSGTYTTLYSFAGAPNDGYNPWAGLVRGSDGNFYGTTEYGGTSIGLGYLGMGTVFRISPSGTYTSLYAFGSQPDDGQNPRAGLVQGSDGNFYGTTALGPTEHGAVFRISPSGDETNLHTFADSPNDGNGPHAGLVQGCDGSFYGTTIAGGTYGHGTVFQITPSGNVTILHSFDGSADGGYTPEAGLVQGSDGNLYGTTLYNVFQISPTGSYKNLHSFGSLPGDGYDCQAGLVLGSDGTFYGTTSGGGAGGGIIYRLYAADGLLIYETIGFPSGGGANPEAALVQGNDGSFYGTTLTTVFRISFPMYRPANQISAAQISGDDVALSVPSIAGETYQLQFTTDPICGIWSNVPGASVANSPGALLTLTNFGGAIAPQGFYRFHITP